MLRAVDPPTPITPLGAASYPPGAAPLGSLCSFHQLLFRFGFPRTPPLSSLRSRHRLLLRPSLSLQTVLDFADSALNVSNVLIVRSKYWRVRRKGTGGKKEKTPPPCPAWIPNSKLQSAIVPSLPTQTNPSTPRTLVLCVVHPRMLFSPCASSSAPTTRGLFIALALAGPRGAGSECRVPRFARFLFGSSS